MKLVDQATFRIATADTLGRSLWTLQLEAGWIVFVDHRQEISCSTDKDLRLAEATLENFSVPSIARMLRGLTPIDLDLEPESAESTEIRDEQGRRWSVRSDDEGLLAWTLWSADGPTLWWTRQGKGGILSHRDGSQFRWRQIVMEPSGPTLDPLEPPETYRQVSCHEYDLPQLRQD